MANYDDSVMLGLSIAFAIIATASVIFRFQARKFKRLNLEADDWTLLAALVFDIAVTVALLIDSTLSVLISQDANPNGIKWTKWDM